MVDMSTAVGIVSALQKSRRGENLVESFPKTYRSMLALLTLSWLLVDQSRLENRPRGMRCNTVVYMNTYAYGRINTNIIIVEHLRYSMDIGYRLRRVPLIAHPIT